MALTLPRWVVGVIINCLGSILINLGTNLMKLSHKRQIRHKRPTLEVEALEELIPKRKQQSQTLMSHSPEKLTTQAGRNRGLKNGLFSSNWNLQESMEIVNSSYVSTNHMMISNGNNTAKSMISTNSGNGLPQTYIKDETPAGIELPTLHRKHQLAENFNGNDNEKLVILTGRDSINEVEVEDNLKSSRVWYSGAGTLVTGSLLNFVSFGFAPQSLLASLGSVQFISNVLFGKFILKEIVTQRILFGTATIITGNMVTVIYSPQQEHNYNQQELVSFYDAEYRNLLIAEVLFGILMHFVHKHYCRRRDEGKMLPGADTIMPITYSICSAIVGTQSVIQAKCLSELISMTFRGDNQMGHMFTYLVTILWVSTTVFWLVRMNRALAMFHGLFIIPALQVFWTFFSVIGGGIYFQEFHTLNTMGMVSFSFGVLIVFIGVYFMAPQQSHAHTHAIRKHSHHHNYEKKLIKPSTAPPYHKGVRKNVGAHGSVSARHIETSHCSPKYALHRAMSWPNDFTELSELPTPCAERLPARDESTEIDWERSRMMSIGFFPMLASAEDVPAFAPFLKPFRLERLGTWCDGADIIQNINDSYQSERSRGSSCSSIDLEFDGNKGEEFVTKNGFAVVPSDDIDHENILKPESNVELRHLIGYGKKVDFDDSLEMGLHQNNSCSSTFKVTSSTTTQKKDDNAHEQWKQLSSYNCIKK